jgi:hypothetical protein
MKYGRLRNGFMRMMSRLSSAQAVAKTANVADVHQDLSFTTQNQMFKNESCKLSKNISSPAQFARLKTINPYASPPFVNK